MGRKGLPRAPNQRGWALLEEREASGPRLPCHCREPTAGRVWAPAEAAGPSWWISPELTSYRAISHPD